MRNNLNKLISRVSVWPFARRSIRGSDRARAAMKAASRRAAQIDERTMVFITRSVGHASGRTDRAITLHLHSIKVERSFDLGSDGDRIAVFQSWFKPPMLSCLDGSRGQAKWCTLQHIDRGGPSFSRDYDR